MQRIKAESEACMCPCSVDTACSSSLVAAHVAMTHMGTASVTAGIVGGVSVLLSPVTTTMFQKAGMLALDGRCKTLDASADGYVRGEACGVLLLQTAHTHSQGPDVLTAANGVKLGSNALAVVRGSAVGQDGRSSSLTAPNGPSQQQAIREALASALLEPGQMTALQLHGTGTPLGDPIEMGAAQAVLLQGVQREGPLQIGAAKTWLGHTEAASGIMGLLQAALSMQQLMAPGQHFFGPLLRFQ